MERGGRGGREGEKGRFAAYCLNRCREQSHESAVTSVENNSGNETSHLSLNMLGSAYTPLTPPPLHVDPVPELSKGALTEDDFAHTISRWSDIN